MIEETNPEKKKITKRQKVFIVAIIGAVLLVCLGIGLFIKGQEVETIKGRLDTLEQRNEVLEKENKEMRDLVVYNISQGIPLKKKIAFLTFDDGPSDNTMALLSTLEDAGVKANFFLLGHKIDKHPDAAKAIAADGHGAFVHSDSHQYNQIYSSKETVITDVLTTRKKIMDLGIKEPTIYRFPGGSNTSYLKDDIFAEIKTALKENKFTYVDWNVDSGDARRNNVPAEEIKNNIIEQARTKSTINILMHDTNVKETTIQAMPGVISGLKELGFYFWVIPNGVSGPEFRT